MRLLLSIAALLLLSSPAHATKAPPTDFADYKVEAAPFENAKAVDVTDELAWRYRTELVKGFEGVANYANKYVVIPVSCGVQCQMNWVVDKSTGKIAGMIESAFGVQYKIDSALLVVNGAQTQPALNLPTQFYLIKDGKMIMIHETGTPYPVPQDTAVGVEDTSLCQAAYYGLENCPGDIEHFLGMIAECYNAVDQTKKDTPACNDLPCEYQDLLQKYKGDENHLRSLQENMGSNLWEDPATFGSGCKR